MEVIMDRITSTLLTAALAGAVGFSYAAGETRSSMQARSMDWSAGNASVGMSARSDASTVQGDVPAVAGGVGLNARDALRSDAPRHNVKMVFTLDTGNYLADVNVKVTDSSGKTVIDGVSDGPWLYAQLPPGSYTATATYEGNTVTKRFSTGKGGTTTYFRWPSSVEQQRAGQPGPILGTGSQTAQR